MSQLYARIRTNPFTSSVLYCRQNENEAESLRITETRLYPSHTARLYKSVFTPIITFAT